MTRAGQLRHRVVIERRKETHGDRGQVTADWEDHKTVAANVAPLRGREIEQARKVFAEATYKIECRYISGLTTSDRVRYRYQGVDRHFAIGHVDDGDLSRRSMTLLAAELKDN